MLPLEEFEWCVILLDGIDEEPATKMNDSVNKITPCGNQRMEACEEVEKEEHETVQEEDVRNSYHLLPMQRAKLNHGIVNVKKIFSFLIEGLMHDGPCSTRIILSPPNQSRDLMLGVNQTSRDKLGKFWIKGPQFFVKGEIRREFEMNMSAQIKDRASSKSFPIHDQQKTKLTTLQKPLMMDQQEV